MQSYCIQLMRIFEPMKVLCLSLAIVILWLSCYPCSDGNSSNEGNRNEYSVVDLSNHSDTLPQSDFCSLLCACHCCHVHATIDSSSPLQHAANQAINYTAYIKDFKNLEFFKFLQPPIS